MEQEHVASIKLAELLNFFQIIDHFGCFMLNSAISEFRTQNFDIHSNLGRAEQADLRPDWVWHFLFILSGLVRDQISKLFHTF